MKKKILKALAIVSCAVLLVVGSVAGTMAYLRSTAEVVNTFTFGNVSITMDETLIGEDGQTPQTDLQRVTGNRYMLLPGTTYKKDPLIHIGASSESMYLFVKIDNGIAGLAGGNVNGTEKLTIHQQMLNNGWMVLNTADSKPYFDRAATVTTSGSATLISTSTVYYFAPEGTPVKVLHPDKAKVSVEGFVDTEKTTYAARSVKTFENFTLTSSDLAESIITAYVNNNAKISVTAFGVQTSGMESFSGAAAIFANEFASAVPNSENNGGNTDFDALPAAGDPDLVSEG